MKQEKISIYTDRTIEFTADVPETKGEHTAGLTYMKEIPQEHGMLYYAKEDVELKMWTADTPFPVDFLFIDWCGNICKIVTAEPFSKEIHECINSKAVFEIKGGECKRLDIQEGDTFFYSETRITSENEYIFGTYRYKKVTKRNLKDIHFDDLCFVALAEFGAMGWNGTMQFIGRNKNGNNMHMIDLRSANISEEDLNEIFPPLKDFSGFGPFAELNNKEWHLISLGCGNHLFVKNNFYEEFSNKIENLPTYKIYGSWERIAEKILNEN